LPLDLDEAREVAGLGTGWGKKAVKLQNAATISDF
jgi:hypothetical protein